MKKQTSLFQNLSLFWKKTVAAIRHPSGAVAVSFALTFPATILFYSVAIDGARLTAGQARLADGVNQGILAIAMTDNRNASQAQERENYKMLKEYLHYYLPDAAISNDDLTIKIAKNYTSGSGGSKKLDSVDYQGEVAVIMQPIIKGGFSDKIWLSADSGSGVVRITMQVSNLPTDYAFVLDFSGSMTSPSAEWGKSRIALLKMVINDFVTAVLEENQKSQIALVPFSIGVPVRLPEEKNPAGGERIGCSFVGKLKQPYHDLDLNFWYNKSYTIMKANRSNLVTQSHRVDDDLREYYRAIIAPVTDLSMDEMVKKGWCVKNDPYGSSIGKAQYSCSKDPRAKMSNPELHTQQFISKNSAMQTLLDTVNLYQDGTISNLKIIDLLTTLKDDFIFKESSVTTFPLFYATSRDRPFYYMCNGALLRGQAYNSTIKATIKQPLPDYYLIELTSDKNILKAFNKMEPSGGTDSSLALLRAVPVLAKGKNPRKVIIVISDGQDLGSNGSGPLQMTNTLHKENKICNKIRDGLLLYPEGTPTKQSDIYYISVVTAEERRIFWERYCTGEGKAFIASDYKKLMETLMGIARDRRIDFINKDEEKPKR